MQPDVGKKGSDDLGTPSTLVKKPNQQNTLNLFVRSSSNFLKAVHDAAILASPTLTEFQNPPTSFANLQDTLLLAQFTTVVGHNGHGAGYDLAR